MDEKTEKALLSIIRGDRKFIGLGNGLHTFPGRDTNNQELFDACVELEEKGLIKRKLEEQGHVLWVAINFEIGPLN